MFLVSLIFDPNHLDLVVACKRTPQQGEFLDSSSPLPDFMHAQLDGGEAQRH